MCQSVKPDAPMLALEFRDFEQQYHLPKRIDLEADPETALQDAGVLPDDAARNCLLGAPAVSFAAANDTVSSTSQTPSLGTVSGSHLPTGNCAITSPVQKSAKKRKKHHRRRGERVPLPKGLWKVVDPDAPFRAYTSDGRELTRCQPSQAMGCRLTMLFQRTTRCGSIFCPQLPRLQYFAGTFAFRPLCFQYFTDTGGRGRGYS